jgi:hypothetical protein
MHERRRPDREVKPMITTIPAEQAAAFSILRRPADASDRLPDQTLTGGRMGELGFNPALARRASTQVGDLWVVPGSGFIALYNGNATATPTAYAVTHGTVMWGSSAGLRPNVATHGLVPDGVEEVTLFAAAEPRHRLQPGVKPTLVPVTLAVKDNVYGTLLAGEFVLGHFLGPAGTIEFGPQAH